MVCKNARWFNIHVVHRADLERVGFEVTQGNRAFKIDQGSGKTQDKFTRSEGPGGEYATAEFAIGDEDRHCLNGIRGVHDFNFY